MKMDRAEETFYAWRQNSFGITGKFCKSNTGEPYGGNMKRRNRRAARMSGDIFFDGRILAWRVEALTSSPEGRALMRLTARRALKAAESVFKEAQVTPEQMQMVITI